MRELDLTGLEVTENGCVVRLERTPAAPVLPRETVAVPRPASSRGCAPGRDHGGLLSHGGGLLQPAPAENAEPFVRWETG